MEAEQSNKTLETIWAIRDARGLTTYEKVFLFHVASRGVCESFRQTILNDTAMSDGMLSKVVKSLSEKGLIDVEPRKTKSRYRVNEEALSEWQGHSHSEGAHHVSATDSPHEHSPHEDAHHVSADAHDMSAGAHHVSATCSPREDNKRNIKKNKKKNIEEVKSRETGGTEQTPNLLDREQRRARRNQLLIQEALDKKKSEETKGREWLETLLTRNDALTEDEKEEARRLFDDKTWKPNQPLDAQRAAMAELYARPAPEPVVKEKVLEDVW